MARRRSSPSWSDVADDFGARVRDLRMQRELTQEDLAEAARISRNQVQNIEHSRNNTKGAGGRPGPGNPRMDTVFALAHALEVDVAYLLTGVEPDGG